MNMIFFLFQILSFFQYPKFIIFIYLLFNLQQYEKILFQDPFKKVMAKTFMSLLACSSSAQSYACKGKDHFIVFNT